MFASLKASSGESVEYDDDYGRANPEQEAAVPRRNMADYKIGHSVQSYDDEAN
nr:hypothetical protein [uncultured Cohaesibacter sp.]